MTNEDPTLFFWDVAGPFLANATVSRSTMMGFPCLRVNGDFFASADHRTGDLVVKLPAARVQELIESGVGRPFAPNGRRFREWVTLADRDAARWEALMHEACAFVGSTT